MSFGLMILTTGIVCSVLTIMTLVAYTDVKLINKILISFFITLCWFAPAWTGAIRKYNFLSEYYSSLLYTIGYALFGAAFILFSVLLIRDISWYIMFGISKLFNFSFVNPKDAAVLYKANIWAVIVSIALTFYAIYEGTKFPHFNKIDINSPKIKKDSTVVFISDLHITRVTRIEKIKELVNKVNALEADVIALGGDIIDDLGLNGQLNELANLKAKHGVYVVLGNHEVYRGYYQSRKKFEELGFNFLLNRGEKINGFYIAGIPDFGTNYFPELKIDMEKTLKGSSTDDYKILLSHHPRFIETLKNNEIDLQLSGHTHGGQIFPFHLLVKQENHYLAGLYQVENMKLIVSRGASIWGPPMRLFAPSDIIVIRLKNK